MNQKPLCQNKDIELSVVITYSQAQRYDPPKELYYAYKNMLDDIGIRYEVIFIIDGEREVFENARKKIIELKDAGENIKIIKLARWFGEGTALSIAFEHSCGETILTLPPYEQVEINDIPSLIDASQDSDMVVGNRWPRLDSLLNRVQSKIFHYLACFRGDYTFHDLGCSVRCFKRKILEKVHIYGEQHRFFPILVFRYGYKVVEFDIAQTEKDAFQKFYPSGTYLRRFMDLVSVFFLVKFTKKPLRFFGIAGFLTFFSGIILSIYLFVERIFLHVPLRNRPLLLLDLLLFVLGIQLFAIGLIGEIIIFTHAKEMKDYTIEKIIN
jgi:glycosyltransferase involved in cell wall biosynthesis